MTIDARELFARSEQHAVARLGMVELALQEAMRRGLSRRRCGVAA